MDGWHRMDDPENQPPKDGRMIEAMLMGGVSIDIRWIHSEQRWSPKVKPTHWKLKD